MNDYNFEQEIDYQRGHDMWEHSIGGGYDLENRRWNQLVSYRGRSRFGPAPTSGLYLPYQLLLVAACVFALVIVALM
jgi:hypothetical protein